MSKIKLISAYSNVIKKIKKTFSTSERDKETGIKHWKKTLDFKIVGSPRGETSNIITDKNGKPLKIFEFDLSKIKRRDGNAPDEVSICEFLEAVKACSGARFTRGEVKILLTDEIKSEIVKAVKDGIIDKNANLVTDQVMVRQRVNIIPDLGLDIVDEEISGMEDLEKAVKAKKSKQLDNIKDDIDKKLEV
jgi:hypothetical protein